MKYLGSKARIRKQLIPLILANRNRNQYYWEPFVGGCNLIQDVPDPRIGTDSNSYLIALWQKIQQGWIPPQNISEEEYRAIKLNQDQFPPELVAFVGFGCSFGSKWFGGYARGKNEKGIARNYAQETYRELMRQQSKIATIEFKTINYFDFNPPPNSIIYCDPPYAGTTKFKDSFDHEIFWEWCRDKSREGHNVFVSEYQAPLDWESIWTKEIHSSFAWNRKQIAPKKGTENLFVLKNP